MIKECQFRKRAAWQLSNERISLTVVQGGGYFAELKLMDGECPNLLWEPPWDTMDPDEFEPAMHGPKFGGGSEARLLSGILGHNLCFPFWGDPSAAEYAAGATFHGESNVVRWRCDALTNDTLVLSATMPESQTRMQRAIHLTGSQLNIECTAKNLSTWDRPVAWCEHVTFGPPFLSADATEFEASVGNGFVTGKEHGAKFRWPQGRGDIDCDLTRFASSIHRDLVNSFVVDSQGDEAFFRTTNRNLGVAVEYRFSPVQFPWLNVWENHTEQMQTRAMEFSNTPRHGTMKTLMQTAALLDRPVYDWLDAAGSLTKQFTITVFRI